MLRPEDYRASAAPSTLLLPAVQLTASGRPELAAGEAELASLHKVDLQFQDQGGVQSCIAKRHEDGVATLTAHRLLWADAARAPSAGASCQLHLSCIDSIELSSTKRWSQTKLRIKVHVDQRGCPVSAQSSYTQLTELRLISRHYGTFPDLAKSVLYQRAWEHVRLGQTPEAQSPLAAAYLQQSDASHGARPSQRGQEALPIPDIVQQLSAMGFPQDRAQRACLATNNSGVQLALQWLLDHEHDPQAGSPLPNASSTEASHQQQVRPMIGIAGILKREQEIAAQNDRTLDEAFQDLRGLMAKAQEMVQLAEKFRETLASKGGEAESSDIDMQRELIEMGIASPVTKDTAGARYHQQLSGQLRKAGGIITLADVYCLFNRARGAELISPDDLLQAVNLFPSTGASMSLRAFPTGVLVVQSDSHDDDEVCARIAEMVTGGGCGPSITAAEVAAAFAIPITIAAQHLATAESKAILCRDNGPEGLRFFRNFFEEVPAGVVI